MMDDIGDGTYTKDWRATATGGTVTVTVSYFSGLGFDGQYFASGDWTGTPTAKTDAVLNWYTNPLPDDSFYSITWTGYLLVPKTDDYTFTLSADDYV